MDETKMWERIDKAFANFDEVFQDLGKFPVQLDQRSGYYIVNQAWTTATPTYSDGFTDGWNAHEATQ